MKVGGTTKRKSVGTLRSECAASPVKRCSGYAVSPGKGRRCPASSEPTYITPVRTSSAFGSRGRSPRNDAGCSRGRLSPCKERGRSNLCTDESQAMKRSLQQRNRQTLPAATEDTNAKERAVTVTTASCAAAEPDTATMESNEFSGVAPAAEEWLAVEVLVRSLFQCTVVEDVEPHPILIRDLLVRVGALKASDEWMQTKIAKPGVEAAKRKDSEERLRDAIRTVVAKEKERDTKLQERNDIRDALQRRLVECDQNLEKHAVKLKEARSTIEDCAGHNLMLRYSIQQDQQTHVQLDEKWTRDLKVAAAELGKAKGALMLRNADLEVERKASQQVAGVLQEQQMELHRREAVLSQAQESLNKLLVDTKALKRVLQARTDRNFVENDVKKFLLEKLVASHKETARYRAALVALQTRQANFADSEAAARKQLGEISNALVCKMPAERSTVDEVDNLANEEVKNSCARHPQWALDQSRRSLHRGDASSESDTEEVHLESVHSDWRPIIIGEDGVPAFSPFSVSPSEQSTCPSSNACRGGGPPLLLPQLSLNPAPEQPKLAELESDVASDDRFEDQVGAEISGLALMQPMQTSSLLAPLPQPAMTRACVPHRHGAISTQSVPRTATQSAGSSQVHVNAPALGQTQVILASTQVQTQASAQAQMQLQAQAGVQVQVPAQAQAAAPGPAQAQAQAQAQVLVKVPSKSQLPAQRTALTKTNFTAAAAPSAQLRTRSQGMSGSKTPPPPGVHCGGSSRSPPPSFAPPAFIGIQQIQQRGTVHSEQSSGGSWYAGMRQTAAGVSETQHSNSWYMGASVTGDNLKTHCGGSGGDGSADQYEQARAALIASQCQDAGPKDSRKQAMEQVYNPVPGSQSGATSTSLNDYVSYGKSLLSDLKRKLG